jgi:hypothetical protein
MPLFVAVLAALAVDRTDVDDAPVFAVAHAGKDRFGHVEAAAEVHVDDLAPHLVGHVHDGAVAGDAGVVHQYVHGAQLGLDLLHPGLAGVEVGDIPAVGGDAGAFGELAGAILVARIVGGDEQASIFQSQGNRLADAPGATRHNRHTRHLVVSSSGAFKSALCFCDYRNKPARATAT